MFKRKKNKKGFTLIEMMAVIAIIAVLVSIVVPTVGGHLTKANAATNAANMRAIKGQVSTMMLQGQINYITAQDNTVLFQYIDEAKEQTNSNAVKRILEGIKTAINTATELTNHYNNTYYAEDGEIDIDGVILNAPASKAVDVDGFKLRKNTQMAVTVTANEVLVTYGGVGIDVFAMIAEDGEATKVGEFDHTYVDGNGDLKCDTCGKYDHDLGDIAGGIIDGVVSGGSHTCQDTSTPKDCICDIDDCGLKIPCQDELFGGDGYCNNCGACMRFTDSWFDSDELCDTCNKTRDEH